MKKILKTLVLGILAGAAIGLGSLLYTICNSKNLPLLGSACFSIGLILVCVFGLFLYTGKIGFLPEASNKKSFALDLLIGYIGNIIGAITFGYLMLVLFKGNTVIESSISSIASKRLTDLGNGGTPFYKEIISGIFCGMLVFIAVYQFKKDFNIVARLLILAFCVFAFVASGFEHCIANMFYVSMANMWNLQSIMNILIITVSNSIGALVLMSATKLIKTA